MVERQDELREGPERRAWELLYDVAVQAQKGAIPDQFFYRAKELATSMEYHMGIGICGGLQSAYNWKLERSNA